MRRLACFTLLGLLAPAPAAEVIVTVTAAETGEPLAGAEAALLLQYEGGSPGVEVHRVKTGADGVARLECPMPAGTEAWEHLYVRTRGRKQWNCHDGGPDEPMTRWVPSPKLLPEDRHTYAVALGSGPTVQGVVLDPAGRPVAGATVAGGWCRYNGYASVSRMFFGAGVYWPPPETTGADGRFELWSIRTDRAEQHWVAVQASHPDYAPHCLVGIERLPPAADGLINLVLRLDPPASLDGIVMGDGLPVPDAKVELEWRYRDGLDDPNWLQPETHTGADGGFRFDGLAPCRWTMTVTAPGWKQHRAEVDVNRGGGEPQVIELQPGHSLELTVVDADGEPAADRWLRFQTDTFFAGGHTDRAGKLILDGLPAGTDGQVRVMMGPTMAVKVPTEPVTLRLQPAVPLRLQVIDALTGAPIGKGCRLGWNDAGGSSSGCEVADDGRPVTTIHPGEYTFSIGLPDRPRIWLKATVPDAVDYPDIVLTVPPGERVFGKITDATGKPLAGAKIRSYARRWWPDEHETVNGDDGRWDLPGLAGDVSLFVAAAGYAPVVVGPLKLEESGGKRPLDFRLERGGTIDGVLRTADGRPRPWRTIRARLQGDANTVFEHPLPLAITADDGTFRLENVPLGMVTVFGDGAQAEVAVSAGEVSKAELVR